ncbi:MAG: EF-hand domain-containing protein [Pirellulales bacterium]
MPNILPRIAMLVAIVVTIGTHAHADDTPGSAAFFTRLDANQDGQLTADEIAKEHQRLFARLVRSGDANDDSQLTSEEFTAALTPSRPEKPIEKQQDADFPGAKATKWLLLTLDTNRDSRLVADEIPEEFQRVFERLVDQIDRDEDDILNRGEINRGGPQLARQAVQTIERMEINVDRELAKIAKEQGDRANRFDEAPDMRQALSDPSNAREFFDRLDENGDGYVTLKELPDPLRERLSRPFRRADADGNERLSPEEFATLARRLGAVAGFMERRSAKPKP